jgi:hypothetical protein
MPTTEKVTADLSQGELETVLKRRAYERSRQQSAKKPFKELTPEEQIDHLRRRGVFNR